MNAVRNSQIKNEEKTKSKRIQIKLKAEIFSKKIIGLWLIEMFFAENNAEKYFINYKCLMHACTT